MAPALDLVFAGTHIQIPISIILVFIHLSFAHVYAILFAAAMKGSKGENVTSVSQITHSFFHFLLSLFSFPWQLYAQMVVNMAVVPNLETVSELLCENGNDVR